MVGQYILDTDTLSLLERGNQRVSQKLRLQEASTIFISVVSVAEQIDGRFKFVKSAKTLEQSADAYRLLIETVETLRDLQILPLTVSAMKRYERLWAMKLNVGKNDLRIAAIALENDVTVVTRNTRDFERVPGLRIENWAE